MDTIKVKNLNEIPRDYTGIIEYADGEKEWRKNGRFHREDGPAYIRKDGYKSWYLDGTCVWQSGYRRDLRNKIILSKTKHPEYPLVQIWKILDKDKVYEKIIIPGMEAGITE